MNHPPLQNIEAEKVVIGAMLVSEPAVGTVVDRVGLKPGDFYLDQHRQIFAAMRGLHSAGKPVDQLTVAAALEPKDLTRLGGKEYLFSLSAQVTAPGNVGHHADIVKQLAVRRSVWARGDEIKQLAARGASGTELLDKVDQVQQALTENVSGPGPRRKLRQLDVKRMVGTSPPEVPWRVAGLAVDGTLTLLAGREGQGKSLIAQSLAGAVVRGESLAGFGCSPGRVLVVDAENGEHEIWRRTHTLGLPSEVVVVEASDFHLGRDLHDLKRLLGKHQPQLLILDSFRSLWPGGDENDSARVSEVLDPLRNTVRQHNVATILLHHDAKSGYSGYRGSSAIGAAVEIIATLERVREDPQRRVRRKLTIIKNRIGPEPPPKWVALQTERDHVFVEETDPFLTDREKAPEPPKRVERARQMLAAIETAASAGRPLRTLQQLGEAIGIDDSKSGTIRRVRDLLINNGEIVEEDGAYLPGAKPVAPDERPGVKPKVEEVPECQAPIGGRTFGTLASGEYQVTFDPVQAVIDHFDAELIEDPK